MKILTAPFYSLFSIRLYREAIQAPLSKGFAYLAYLSAIATLLFLVSFSLRAMPMVDDFFAWLKGEMPTLTWTQDHMVMDAPGPRVLVHPRFGTVAVFDMNVTDVTPDQVRGTPVFVTSRKLFVRQAQEQLTVYDFQELLGRRLRDNPNVTVQITGQTMEQIYRSVKPWILILVPLFLFVFYFVFKLLAALLFSVIGLIVNGLRKSRLGYAAILNVTFFALTATTLLELAKLHLPVLEGIPYGFLGALLVTGIYLFVGIKLTEEQTTASG